MKKFYSYLVPPLLVVLATLSMQVSAAETGNDCTRPGNDPQYWYGTLNNALDVPVVLVIPRDQWQCADWLGTNTPGQLNWLRLEPGQSHKFSMWLMPKGAANSSVSLFTMQVRFLTQAGGGFNLRNERVGLNTFQGIWLNGTDAFIYTYNPNRWVYVNEAPVDNGSIPLSNGKTATISYVTGYINVPGGKLPQYPSGTITFKYQ